jgi:transposase, IS30 family
MTYTHLTTDELVLIESYHHNQISTATTALRLYRSRQTIHNVVQFLKQGYSALDYYRQYKQNK